MNKGYIILFVLVWTLAAGCGTASKQAVSKTERKEDSEALLNLGLEAYKARNYENAKNLLFKASGQNLSGDQLISAHKHLAFIHALQKNTGAATKEFLKAFYLDKDFQLDNSETGNPLWMPSFIEAAKQFTQTHAAGSELYSEGTNAFEKRNYNAALASLEAAVKKEDLSRDKKAAAYKFIAFIYSIQKKPAYAKAAFRKAFRLNNSFELDKSEYGNPAWTPLYDEVKKEFKK